MAAVVIHKKKKNDTIRVKSMVCVHCNPLKILGENNTTTRLYFQGVEFWILKVRPRGLAAQTSMLTIHIVTQTLPCQ